MFARNKPLAFKDDFSTEQVAERSVGFLTCAIEMYLIHRSKVLQISLQVNMLLCMKLKSDEIDSLARRIDGQRRRDGLTYADLARKSGVHPSQVQRICHADFRTLGSNIMQICTVLGIDSACDITIGAPTDPDWLELQRTVRMAWDGTPSGASAITELIRAAVAFRRSD